ncbi:MAG TPA: TonB C-terminal domain-containing protein [Allosphingosinicella sp.]|jgi:outer membrane biosynthesis protein TonB
MDRAEAAGLGVATAGHLALLAALSFGFAASRLPAPKSAPIEVSFVDEVGLESTAPAPSAAEPAALLAPEEGPPEAAMPAPPQVQPIPQPQPAVRVPAPAPQPTAKAASQPKPSPAPPKPAPKAAQAKPKPAPAKPAGAAKVAATRPTGRLSGLLAGVSDRNTESRSTARPAAAAGPAVQASLGAEVRRQLKPHWKAPTGADSEQLRTEVIIALAQDGRVTDIRIAGTTGQTASNRPQVPLHREQAERAVRLAAPFRLPAQYYEAWKSLRVTFDKRLSQ